MPRSPGPALSRKIYDCAFRFQIIPWSAAVLSRAQGFGARDRTSVLCSCTASRIFLYCWWHPLLYRWKCFSYKVERLHWQVRNSVCLALAFLDIELVSGCTLIKCCYFARKEAICLLPSLKSRVFICSIVLCAHLLPYFLYTVETVVSWVSDLMSSIVCSVCPAQEGEKQQERQSNKKLKLSQLTFTSAETKGESKLDLAPCTPSLPCHAAQGTFEYMDSNLACYCKYISDISK